MKFEITTVDGKTGIVTIENVDKSMSNDQVLDLIYDKLPANIELASVKNIPDRSLPEGEAELNQATSAMVGSARGEVATPQPEQLLDYKNLSPKDKVEFNQNWRDDMKDVLKAYYKGDFDTFYNNIAQGKMPKISGSNRDQKIDFIRATKALTNFNPESETPATYMERIDPENRYADVVNRATNLKNWAGEDRGISETLFPNLSVTRQDPDSGGLSKGLAAAQDVSTIIPRALTAGVGEFTPESDYLSFSERFGRPEAYSSPGERFFDFAGSGAGGGAAIKGGTNLAGKVPFIAAGVDKLGGAFPRVQQAGRLLSGKPIQSATDIVGEVGSGVSRAQKVPIGSRFAQGALRGTGEGLRTSALPAAFTATQPEELGGSAGQGALEFGLGTGISALAGGVGGALRPQLTGWGDELTGGYSTVKRLQNVADDYPTSTSAEGVEQLERIKKLKNTINSQIGDKRAKALKELADNPNLMIDPEFPNKAYSNTRAHDMIRELTSGNVDDLSMDGFDLYKKEVSHLSTKLKPPFDIRTLQDGAETVIPEFVDEMTRIRRIMQKTNDPDKKQVYRTLYGNMLNAEKRVLTQIADAPMKVDNLSYGSATDVLETRGEFAEVNEVFDFLPKEGKEEAFLRKAGRSRLTPMTRAKEAAENVDAIDDVKKLLNKYNINVDRDKLDYMTPAVMREIRQQMKGGDGTIFQSLMNRILTPVSFGPIAVGKAASGPYTRSILSGGGTPQYMTSDDYNEPMILKQSDLAGQ